MSNFDEHSDADLMNDLVNFTFQLRPLYLKLPFFKNIRQMTYKKAIEYFVENKPPIPFETGVMIIEREDKDDVDSAFFVQVFLDKNNQPVSDPVTGKPYGRRCLIRGMDDELTAVFGDKQVVIVK